MFNANNGTMNGQSASSHNTPASTHNHSPTNTTATSFYLNDQRLDGLFNDNGHNRTN